MQKIEELRDSLIDNYEKMKSNKMDLKTGKELANTAAKIFNSLRLQLDYNKQLRLNNKIKFMEEKKSTSKRAK